MKINECLCQVAVGCAFQDADEFDLAEAGVRPDDGTLWVLHPIPFSA